MSQQDTFSRWTRLPRYESWDPANAPPRKIAHACGEREARGKALRAEAVYAKDGPARKGPRTRARTPFTKEKPLLPSASSKRRLVYPRKPRATENGKPAMPFVSGGDLIEIRPPRRSPLSIARDSVLTLPPQFVSDSPPVQAVAKHSGKASIRSAETVYRAYRPDLVRNVPRPSLLIGAHRRLRPRKRLA